MANTMEGIQPSHMFYATDLTPGADLIESLDHPLVPVVQHVQPLHLSLPEHRWRYILSSGYTTGGRKKNYKAQIIFCAFLLEMTANDTSSLLLAQK